MASNKPTETPKQVAIRFPAKLYRQADAAAKKESRSFSNLIRRAVEWYIGRGGEK